MKIKIPMINKLEQETLEYLGTHRIPDLITALGVAVIHDMPSDLNTFLIQVLERIKSHGTYKGMQMRFQTPESARPV